MVRWLVLFLVALLPLRGWVGDAMAGAMQGHHTAAVQATAHHADAARPPAHEGEAHQRMAAAHDCAHHERASPDGGQPAQASQAADDGPTCASCQVCSALAMVFDTPAPPLTPQPSPTPSWSGHGYASAEPAPTFKPPIS